MSSSLVSSFEMLLYNEMFDLLPQDAAWGHAMAQDADGLELHYVRRGQGRSTVLLLHGWPGFWYDWRRVLPRLEQITLVIAMDLRGFGASAKPDWPARSAYSAQAQARNVLALLDQLHLERVVFVGYDVGSRVAQTVAQMEPLRVQALALVHEGSTRSVVSTPALTTLCQALLVELLT